MTQTGSRIFPQFLRLGVGLFLGKLCLLGVHFLAARFLPLADYGLFALLFSVNVLLYFAFGAEQSTVVAREVAHAPQHTRRIVREAMFMHAGVILLLALLWLFFLLPQGSSLTILTGGLLSWLGMEWLLSGPKAALRAQGHAGLESLAYLGPRLALLVFAPLGILVFGLSGLGLAFLLASITGLLAGWKLAAPRLDLGSLADLPPFSSLWQRFQGGLLLAGASLLATAYARQDQLLLGLFKNTESVGLYAACASIMLGLAFIPQVLSMIWLPHWAASPRQQDRRLLQRSLLGMALLGLLVGLPFWFWADSLLDHLFHLSHGEGVLRWLVVAEVLNMANYTFGVFLRARGEDKAILRALLGGFLLNLALNLVMIPLFAATGAAITTLVSYGFVLLLQGRYAVQMVKTGKVRRDSDLRF